MEHALSRIGYALNELNVVWAVGGSLMLHQHGLAGNPRDIDILVALEDAEKAENALGALGETVVTPQSAAFATKRFRRFLIDGIDVDLMAGFIVCHGEGQYEYPFDRLSVASHLEVGGEAIPFAALEDWYIVYQMMPGKAYKADGIENALITGGIRRPDLLRRALEGCLTGSVRARILALPGLDSSGTERFDGNTD